MQSLKKYIFLLTFWGTVLLPGTDIQAQEIIVEDLPLPAKSEKITVGTSQTIRSHTSMATPSNLQKPQIASLSFSWSHPVNMAAFERNGNIWVVFDKPQKIDIEELKKTAGDLVKNIFQFPHPMATLLRITPAPDVKFSVRKEGLLWILDLFTDHYPPQEIKNMTIFTQYDGMKQPYLFIPTDRSGNVIGIIDPEIGDLITIAPLSSVGVGTTAPYRYPEFDILQTQQGLAFVIKAPDIMLERGNSGLTLKAPNRGLSITGDLDSLKRRQKLQDTQTETPAFNLQIPQKLREMKFVDAVDTLRQDILSAPPSQKNKARLELARYYLYHGLGTNTLYILNQMKEANIPEAATDNFHAMRGIANFLTKRYAEAEKDFEQGGLPSLNEGIFWRTLAQSAYTFKENNNAVLFSNISLIRDYPQEIKDQVAIVATQNALASNDDLAAQNFIDILRSVSSRAKNLDPQINYLYAKKLELQGYPRNAIKEYRNIAESSDAKFSALARYDNAVLSQRIGQMKTKDAISELEKLRFAWSEPSFKFKLLNTLAGLYVKDFDYYKALKTLEENASFATTEQKESLANRMQQIFEDIYIGNQDDAKLSPIKSLALYQDFKWLGERSPRQNTIIQKLADRLVAVDLLPRAAGLLNELLLKDNLSAENRARIGARLAIISLFEQQPNSALEILDKTEYDNLSLATAGPRRIIRARALSQLGQTDDALSLLADDYGKNATLLKFEMYWNAGQWSKASDTIKYLIEDPKPGQPLSVEQINYILDWATTLKKAGKETVLVRLRNKFMPYFANTKYHGPFNILTNHLEKDKVDLKEINSIVNDVRDFNNFSKFYTDSLKNTDVE